MKSSTALKSTWGLIQWFLGCVRLAALVAASLAIAKADTASQVRIFVASLRDQDAQIREGAINALAALKSEKEIEGIAPQVAPLLEDSDPNVRYAAAKALQVLKADSEIVIDALIKALNDRSPLIRIEAVNAIETVGIRARRATPRLLEILHEKDWDLRYAAVQALGSIGADPTQALPALLAIVHETESGLNQPAIESIGKLLNSATPSDQGVVITTLINQLGSPVRGERLRSQEALKAFAERAKDKSAIVSALAKTVKDDDETVRWKAVDALAALGSQETIAPFLIELAKDLDFKVRKRAIEGIEPDGSDDAIPALLGSLKDKVAEVRVAALKGLEKAKATNGVICREEIKLADDRDANVRQAVADALGGCEQPVGAVVGILLLLSDDGIANVRSSAIKSVTSVLGGGSWQGGEPISNLAARLDSDTRTKVVARVVEAVSDPDANVRVAAASGVLKIAPVEDSFIPKLLPGLRDPNPYIQDYVARLLSSFGQSALAGTPDLIRLLKSEGSVVRAYSAQALGFIGARSALQDLTEALELETDEDEAKPIIARAVGRISNGDSTAIPPLVSALSGGSDTRKAAVWALSTMGTPAKDAIQRALSEAPVKKQEADALEGLLGPRSDAKQSLTKALAELQQLQSSVDLNVTSFDGKHEKIVAGPNQFVILMATWCPHSKALMELLSNKNIERLTRGATFTFVFRDEWPDITHMLKEDVASGRLAQGQDGSELRRLKARAGNSLLFDPEFVKHLPGKAYLLSDDRLLPDQIFFPRVFWPATSKFEVDAETLAKAELGLPSWILERVKW